MDIKEQVAAKEKAFNVVRSCRTVEQCETAMNFINNYYDLTEDGLGYNYLITELNEIIEGIYEGMLD